MDAILAIARTTLYESIRSRILYTVVFFAALVVVTAALFGTVTIGDQVKVIKDLGLCSITIFAVAFAVIAGGALLHKELSRKTIYNILAKPVDRAEFVLGKFLGMYATVLVLITLMGVGLSLFVRCFESSFDWSLLDAYLCIGLELSVICAMAIFFSAIVVTPLLSGLFSFAAFIAGRSAEYVLLLAPADGPAASHYLLTGVYWILPHLSLLNVADRIVDGQPLSFVYIAWAALYAWGYSGIVLMLGAFIFRFREFN